ncbi:basic amino acid ABC transporter substrate-binding protein [Paenibacillus beijingensis]|uniref:ABC transporter substrate-binding protein n=1 Tax=Paenibacillus beijingensis TaxID=1126833 RepID=A0A0D5NK74_9BACL|nr:basic amino acid ABC transporter substrate-binding protein [Paenibacillus beijingensis]AJY75540.1 ABC transporter substrate-binding protein [Paenibacillus beijingensis]
MKKTKILMYVLAMVLTLSLAACGSKQNAESESTGASGGDSQKEYLVGTDASYAPFESMTADNQFVGFDMEIVQAIADKGGFKIKLINTPWEGIFATLNSGDRDIIISAVTITEERLKEYDFSDPYFDAKQSIAVPKTSSVQKFDDLKDKVVGVQTGTTGDEVVTKLLGADSGNIKRLETTPLALKELENGGVDAVVADNGVVNNYVKNNSDKGFKTVDDASFAKESYGLVTKKGNKELLDKINAGLKAIKEDGTYDTIYQKYFGE